MYKLSKISLILIALCSTSASMASDFVIPFVNTSGLGVLYADWATSASDASTAYTNPAGLVKLEHQQFVFSGTGLTGSARFNGTATTPPYPFPGAIIGNGAATSRLNAVMPSFYYALPISKRLVLGFGANAPFGLGTNYQKDSLVRYFATRSQIVGIDVGPSVGFKVNDSLSVGAGIDALRLSFTLNNMYGPPLSVPDALLHNQLVGWGYGWHAGVLQENASTHTRFGFSYNSMIMVHTTGDSDVSLPGINLRYNNQKSNVKLPARVQFSVQHDFNSRWTGMATVFYTNWRSLQQLTMKRTMTPFGNVISVTIPFNFHNTFDYSAGITFKATDKWLLRTGMLVLNTPTNDLNRGVSDPIGNAYVLGFGAHYQQNAALGYDVGVAHAFVKEMTINNTNPLTSLNGHTNAQTNLLSGQITWNIC